MQHARVLAPTQVRSAPVADPGELLRRLPRLGALAWVQGGEGLVGWGVHARAEFRGPGRFAEAAAWWDACHAELDVDDAVGVPGSGPVVFGSFSFAEQGSSVLVVPRVVLGRRGEVTWTTTVGEQPAVLGTPAEPEAPVGVRYAEGSLPLLAWREAVATAVARIRRGELDKVVLARDLLAELDAPVDVRALLVRLAERYPSCWTFVVDGLLGATPELLIRREGDAVFSRVLAGTVARGHDPDSDGRSADGLRESAKDLGEHDLAVASVAEVLRRWTRTLDVPDEASVLRLANVHHLATDLTGTLAEPVSSLELAGALHPTAAVCGTPTPVARRVIAELEGMDRGRYAGPVGWMDATGDGEWGIALRCAEVQGSSLRLFAGCGIVADSDPDAELAESVAKLVAMRDALEGAP